MAQSSPRVDPSHRPSSVFRDDLSLPVTQRINHYFLMCSLPCPPLRRVTARGFCTWAGFRQRDRPGCLFELRVVLVYMICGGGHRRSRHHHSKETDAGSGEGQMQEIVTCLGPDGPPACVCRSAGLVFALRAFSPVGRPFALCPPLMAAFLYALLNLPPSVSVCRRGGWRICRRAVACVCPRHLDPASASFFVPLLSCQGVPGRRRLLWQEGRHCGSSSL